MNLWKEGNGYSGDSFGLEEFADISQSIWWYQPIGWYEPTFEEHSVRLLWGARKNRLMPILVVFLFFSFWPLAPLSWGFFIFSSPICFLPIFTLCLKCEYFRCFGQGKFFHCFLREYYFNFKKNSAKGNSHQPFLHRPPETDTDFQPIQLVLRYRIVI